MCITYIPNDADDNLINIFSSMLFVEPMVSAIFISTIVIAVPAAILFTYASTVSKEQFQIVGLGVL